MERAGPRREHEAPLQREVALNLEVTPIERRYRLPLVVTMGILGLFVANGLHDGEVLAALVTGLGPTLLVLALTLGSLRARKPYPAQVSHRGVLRDGQLVIARKDLVAGQVLVQPSVTTADVLLVGRPGMPSPLLRVHDRATADQLLRELGLDEDKVLVTRIVPWAPVLHLQAITLMVLACLAAVVLLALAAAAGHGPSLAPSIALVTFIAVALTFSNFAQLSLKIGRDGLLLSTLGRTRFHSFADLEAIRPWPPFLGTSKGVDLVFVGGKVVPVYTRTFRAPGAPGDVQEQLESAWRSYRQARETTGATRMRLARGGREMAAWASDLAQLGRERPGYRDRPLEPEDLAALVESPAAEAEERAAAAFALTAANVDPEIRHRVRVAADAAAAPDLRDALRDLAELEDEEPRVAALGKISSGRS